MFDVVNVQERHGFAAGAVCPALAREARRATREQDYVARSSMGDLRVFTHLLALRGPLSSDSKRCRKGACLFAS